MKKSSDKWKSENMLQIAQNMYTNKIYNKRIKTVSIFTRVLSFRFNLKSERLQTRDPKHEN